MPSGQLLLKILEAILPATVDSKYSNRLAKHPFVSSVWRPIRSCLWLKWRCQMLPVAEPLFGCLGSYTCVVSWSNTKKSEIWIDSCLALRRDLPRRMLVSEGTPDRPRKANLSFWSNLFLQHRDQTISAFQLCLTKMPKSSQLLRFQLRKTIDSSLGHLKTFAKVWSTPWRSNKSTLGFVEWLDHISYVLCECLLLGVLKPRRPTDHQVDSHKKTRDARTLW